MILALAATLTASTVRAAEPALAADGIPVDSGRSVSGNLGADGSDTWRVYVRQGRNYAVWGSNDGQQEVTIRAAGGRVLAAFPLRSGDNQPEGAGFRAPYTGLVLATVSGPGGYSLAAGRDCPGDAGSPCGIAVGQTLRGLVMRWSGDRDWFRTSLRAGVAYGIAVGDPETSDDCRQRGVRVAVHDARGRELAHADTFCSPEPPLVFTPPSSGTYYVDVGSEEEPLTTYTLSLSRAGG